MRTDCAIERGLAHIEIRGKINGGDLRHRGANVTPLTNFEIWSYKLGNKPLKLQCQKLALVISTGTPGGDELSRRTSLQAA
jgi:hypothetical protein